VTVAKPKVSVVIPCRNEAKWIARCLDSVLQNDYPADCVEIVVVDGMSSDGTRDILREYACKHARVRTVDNQRRIIPCAMNTGILAARHEIIVRLDAHATYPPDYLLRCVQLLGSTDADVVGGRTVNSVSETGSFFARLIGVVTSHPFGVGASPFRTRRKTGPADSVVFGAFRRRVFEKIGLFDERLIRNQDNAMWYRIRRHGGQLYFDPDIVAYYYNQSTLRGFLVQAFRTGFWCALTARLNPFMLRLRHVAPMAFVLYVLLAVGLAVAGGLTGLEWLLAGGLLMLAAYLVPDLVFSISMSRGTDRIPGSPWMAPLAFVLVPVYHLAYGLGWWAGLGTILLGRWQQYLGAPADQAVDHLPPLPSVAPSPTNVATEGGSE
jgi:glycosyltransferase involved in cell wall biosynthesis